MRNFTNNSNIVIGIPTYNRLDLTIKMSLSLKNSYLPPNVRIVVYDDFSTEYDEGELRKIFPSAYIHRHRENLGPDANMWYMYKDFLDMDAEFFFNADSDLLFSKNWLEKGLDMISYTDGCLSLFNTSTNHKVIAERGEILIKDSLGAAGTLFSRNVIGEIIKKYPEKQNKNFDWKWSKLLKNLGVELCCSRCSFVQHIGFVGKNANILGFDYGDNFTVSNLNDGQAINDALEGYYKLLKKENYIKYSLDYRLGNSILSPLRKIRDVFNGDKRM